MEFFGVISPVQTNRHWEILKLSNLRKHGLNLSKAIGFDKRSTDLTPKSQPTPPRFIELLPVHN